MGFSIIVVLDNVTMSVVFSKVQILIVRIHAYELLSDVGHKVVEEAAVAEKGLYTLSFQTMSGNPVCILQREGVTLIRDIIQDIAEKTGTDGEEIGLVWKE